MNIIKNIDGRNFYIKNENDCKISMELDSCKDRISIYKINIGFNKPTIIKPIKIRFDEKMEGILSIWSPLTGRKRNIPQWFHPHENTSDFLRGAPITAFVDQNNKNYATACLSESEYFVKLEAYINDFEEKENLNFVCTLFEGGETVESFETFLRIDENGEKAFYQSIKEAARWWQCFYKNNNYITEDAKLPLYSSWYNFHQHPNSALMEKELKIASELGFRTVIIDDGWFFDGVGTGDYAECGAWEIAKSKFPDFKEFVSFAHELDLKVALWFSVPFVGYNNKDFSLLKDKMLYLSDTYKTGVLDPRYPSVRKYIIESYKNIVDEYNLDGLKLDFIDSFICGNRPFIGKNCGGASGRDDREVKEGIKKLFEEMNRTFKRENANFIIEFRQGNIGPSITRYCNMLRVGDCAFDLVANRIGIADLRMFDYNLAVHSDMLYWAKSESKENCALQLLNTMFAVPQISVLLTQSTEEQLKVIKYHLDYWRQNRDVVLNGEFRAFNPEYNYTMLSSENKNKKIVVSYLEKVYKFEGKNTDLFNASCLDEMIIENISDKLAVAFVYDCVGEKLHEYNIIPDSLLKVRVKPAGKIEIRRKD